MNPTGLPALFQQARNLNYLCFGKPHRLKTDESVEERKRGTEEERKSLRKGKGEEKFEKRKRGTEESAPQAKKNLYYVIGRARLRTSAGRRRL